MALSYVLYAEPEVHQARRNLPGNLRQRVRRGIESLSSDPTPSGSRALESSSLSLPESAELRRLRVDAWRLVYAVHEAEKWVWILAIHRRPPYDYRDLPDLVSRLT